MAAGILKAFFTKTNAEPWRDFKELRKGWDKEYDKQLLQMIKSQTEMVLGKDGVDSKTVNIVLVGYIKSGKSSTINSFFSIVNKRISRRAKSGNKTTSFTKNYHSYNLMNELENIILIDTMGIESTPGDGVLTCDIQGCLNGDVEEGYQFDPKKGKENPLRMEENEAHCVMYCVDAETIMEEIPGFRKKMQDVEKQLEINVQDRIILITKIDEICKVTKKDIRKIFHSTIIKKAVEKAATVFQVDENHVFPVKNYVKEMELDSYKNIPLLLALKQAVELGIDYLQGKADMTRRVVRKTEI